MSRLALVASLVALAGPAAAQAPASLDDVHVALTVGTPPAITTYVVLDTFDQGTIATPALETRLGTEHYAITRAFDPIGLSPRAADALARDWIVLTDGGERCPGKLGDAVALELIEAYDPAGAPRPVGPDGEVDGLPYYWAVAAPLEAACGDGAAIALPADRDVALALGPAASGPGAGAAAIALVESLPIHALRTRELRLAAHDWGMTAADMDRELGAHAVRLEDPEHGRGGWMVSMTYGWGCGDGISSLWAWVEEDAAGLRIAAIGGDLDTPRFVLDVDGDGVFEVVHEHGVRRIDGEVAPVHAISRLPPTCPC